MPTNLQVTDIDRLVGAICVNESLNIRGYSGAIPPSVNDDLLPDNNILAATNAALLYYPTTFELRFRLTAIGNGSISFFRLFTANGQILVQIFPEDYTPINVVVDSTIRFAIKDVHFYLA